MSNSIALLGQPNSGKFTIYNNLTGSRQHVGNWAGKTVEKNEGSYTFKGTKYTVTDLPGSYGLSGNSDEEIITTDFIKSGQSDLTVVLVDASQLERSMFMLAEFARLDKPAVLLLNMIDVAQDMGKKINAQALAKKLGIPVLTFNATDTKDYDKLKKLIAEELKAPHKMKLAPPESHQDVKADSQSKFEWVQSHGQLGTENACNVDCLGDSLRVDLVDYSGDFGHVFLMVADDARVHRHSAVCGCHDDRSLQSIQQKARAAGDQKRHDHGAAALS